MNSNLQDAQVSSNLVLGSTNLQKAEEIIRTITLLDISFSYLDDPIYKSNQLLLKIASQVQKIHHKNKFIEKIYLYLFSQERDVFYEDLTKYSNQIKQGLSKAQSLLDDLKSCVDSLIKYTDSFPNDKNKEDYLGIISVNRLKIATIEQNITFAQKHLDSLDKYRTVTLYHLNDAVMLKSCNFTAVERYAELSVDFEQRTLKLNKIKKYLTSILFGCTASGLLNYLASEFSLRWVSTKSREIPQVNLKSYEVPPLISRVNELNSVLFEYIFTFIFIASAICAIFFISGLIHKPHEFAKLTIKLLLLLLPVGSLAVINNILNNTSGTEVVQENYEVITTISFFNLGEYFSLLMIAVSIITFLMLLFVRFTFKDFLKAKTLFHNLPAPK